jgi:3-hydroxyisobutyrate dehydrogenase-like beta-hydroxyacid dehydrogenase
MQQTVTVVGTGRMGSALATALFNQGVATTVWNRTLSKTEPLARLGLDPRYGTATGTATKSGCQECQ